MLNREVEISGKTPKNETSVSKFFKKKGRLKYCKPDEALIPSNNVDNIIEVLSRIQLSRFNKDSQNAFNAFKYYNNSACWPETDMDSLKDMGIKAFNISHKVFKWYVDMDDILLLEKLLGCKIDELQFNTTKTHDQYISYYMSVIHGEIVYFCKYLGIEYVFKKA